jgi:hypothetical protein
VMLPAAHCVHKLPTRARIRIPSRKGDGEFFASVRERLHRCEQVTGVEINAGTGGVLVFYTGDFPAITAYAEDQGIFRLAVKPSAKNHNPNTLTHVTLTTYKNLDARVKKLTGGELDLPGATYLALVGAGIYKIAKGNFAAPAWYTAFWYALNIFLKAKEKSLSK